MLMTRVLLFAAVFMPVIATFVFCLTIIIVLCVYLKEHLKLAIQTAEDKQGMVELQEEGGPDEEEGERLSQKGSPYYERDKANLKVNPMYDYTNEQLDIFVDCLVDLHSAGRNQ